MKKFYENPVVEITVFDVEDVITTSVPGVNSVSTIGNEDAAIAAINSALASETKTAVAVVKYSDNAYQW